MVVKRTCGLPTLELQIRDEFRLGGVRAFDVGLNRSNDAVAARVERDAEKKNRSGRHLPGKFRHPAQVLER